MSNIAAKTSSHFDLSELQPWHNVAFVSLAVCAYEPRALFVAIPCGIVAALVWSHAEKQREARENAARLTGLVNLCAPVVVASVSITEAVPDLMERVEQWKRDLKNSGNPYADIIPVVPYPYSPMLFGPGQLSWAWPIYQRMVGEQQHTENLKWYEGKCPEQLKAIFASQVMPSPKIEAA